MRGDEFFREVDEAVRQERWLQLWNRFGAYLIAAALAIVIGVGGGMAWREYQRSSRLAQAEQYAEAVRLLEQNRPAEAADAFASLADGGTRGYALLARLRAAEARALAGEEEGRLEALQQLAEDGSLAPLYRDLSRMLTAQIELEQVDGEAVAARLEPLTGEGQPWTYSARELKALTQMRAGDTTAARRTLAELASDPAAPANLARRSAELLTALGGPVPDAPPVEEPADAEASQ